MSAAAVAAANVQASTSRVQGAGLWIKSAVCQKLPPPPSVGFVFATEIQSVRPPAHGLVLTHTFQPVPDVSPPPPPPPPPGENIPQAVKRNTAAASVTIEFNGEGFAERKCFIGFTSFVYLNFSTHLPDECSPWLLAEQRAKVTKEKRNFDEICVFAKSSITPGMIVVDESRRVGGRVQAVSCLRFLYIVH